MAIHAWCLMPSHLHLIVSTKGNAKLSGIFRDFKKFTADEIVKCAKEISESRREWMLKMFAKAGEPLTRITNYKIWQDGNHPVELSTNAMIDERLNYIHNNPVNAGIVWKAEDCLSSAIDYAGGKGFLDIDILQ